MSQCHTVFHSKFEKYEGMVTQSVPYDYHSIMHFKSSTDPVTGRPTIVPLCGDLMKADLGSALSPTEYDYLHINLLYCKGEQVD